MKLTNTHIEELYKFTRQHYVYHYDVQSELVDHLANDIEEISEASPKLSFEDARDKSFKKFGVFGFTDVVEKKKSQMTKKYFKIIFRFVKEWFRLPKIILTFLLFVSFYKLQIVQNAYYVYVSIYGFVLFLEVFIIIKNKKRSAKKFKETGKKWMFKEIILINGILNSAFLLFYIFLYFMPNNATEFLLMGNFRRVFSAIFITTILILGYITLVVIPKKGEELLQETYPEYKLV
ncbi:hypothetical protein [Polaribacter sp. IC073]|uniref:hypothetical protein n=1 Tax=Polaribacter sp. IC073 TaxID=2508540 RepID=UPI0011BFE38A|nr:hypothetical protein [Polaribacter sp. IC073]TXD49920.1 hypothetical protein ES045_01695 [Polaribacter sp. IC073]